MLQGDWSSDVCSSDLGTPGTFYTRRRGYRGRWFSVRSFLSGRREAPTALPKVSVSDIRSAAEIGRASCRERQLKNVMREEEKLIDYKTSGEGDDLGIK